MFDLIIEYTDKNYDLVGVIYYEFRDIIMIVNYTSDKAKVLNEGTLNMAGLTNIIEPTFQWLEFVNDEYIDFLIEELEESEETTTELYKELKQYKGE